METARKALREKIEELAAYSADPDFFYEPAFRSHLSEAKHLARVASDKGSPESLGDLAAALSQIDHDKLYQADIFELYQQAYESGSKSGLVQLALFYEEGEIVERDDNKAFELIQEAYELSVPDSSYHLARYYEAGSGVDGNYQKAHALYETAASNGNSDALIRLGLFAREGYLGQKNEILAEEYFQKARDHGSPDGSYFLADLLNRQARNTKDKELVRLSSKYLLEAISREHQLAKNRLALLIWKDPEKFEIDTAERILNLLTDGASKLDPLSVEILNEYVKEENLGLEMQLLANQFKHELFEENNYSLARELALFELNLKGLNNQTEIALSYLEYAKPHNYRIQYILNEYYNGHGDLKELLQKDSTMSYEEAFDAYHAKKQLGEAIGPRPVKMVTPVYPAALQDLQVKGFVDLEFVVNKEGKARETIVIGSSHQAFNAAAIEAIEESKFTPARDPDGAPLNKRAKIRINFDPAPNLP